MKSFFLSHFLPFAPIETDLTEENRRSYLIYFLCWMWAIIIATLFATRVLLNHDFLLHDSSIILALVTTFAITLFINRKGNSKAAAYLFVTICITLTSVAAFVSGGVTTPAMMMFPPAIFAGGILFGKKGGIRSAVICVVITLVMLLLQLNGLLPVSPLFKNPVSYWLGFVAAALVMGVLQYIVNHQTNLAFEKISHQEERYHSLVEQASDPILLSNENTSIIEVNSSACKILGYTRDELLQMKLADVFSSEELEKRPLQIDYLRQHKTILTERQWRTKDKRTLDMEVHTRVLEGQGYLSIARDITERKAIARKLRESEEKHRALTENLSDAIMLINERGRIIYQSAGVGRIGGYNSEEIEEETIFEFIHPDDMARSIEFFKKAQSLPGVPLLGQFRSLHKDGRYIWIEGTITNLLHNESVKAYIVNYHDITERMKYLNDIEEQNKKLREIAWIQSHVVRAPLARMMGLVNVLREIEMDPEEFEKWVGFFNTTADELDAIVHDISVKAKDIPVAVNNL